MWKFQAVLNQDLAILFVMVAGFISVCREIVFKKEDLRIFNLFLFKFTLPASVILGLGIKTDLYNGDIWRFIGAFLMMRAIMLAACALVFGLGLRRSLGEVTANWLATTWISTVILGTPLLLALLGPQYSNLGVVAGISSFIFQLPLMLVLFEVHVWRQENLHATLPRQQPPAEEAITAAHEVGSEGHNSKHSLGSLEVKEPDNNRHQPTSQPAGQGSTADAPIHRGLGSWAAPAKWRVPEHLRWHMTRDQGKRLGMRLVLNHVLWGVGIGLVLSLSTLGYKYLDPGNPPAAPNCTYAAGAGFIYILVNYFAVCTEPIAFFGTGMWMNRKNPVPCGWILSSLYMLVKLVLVPALMVACCYAFDLEGAYARAAVLVATLPVSSAAFVLAKNYNVGEDVTVTNVFLGNLLVLPTTIAWLSFMDAVDLFNPGPKVTPPPGKCVHY